MQHHEFNPPEPLVEGIFAMELTWVLTLFPKTLLDESINQGLVCAHMHSTTQTHKDPDIHVLDGWMQATKTHPAIINPRRWIRTTLMAGLKTVTYAKISLKMVNPRDIAENTEEECKSSRQQPTRNIHILLVHITEHCLQPPAQGGPLRVGTIISYHWHPGCHGFSHTYCPIAIHLVWQEGDPCRARQLKPWQQRLKNMLNLPDNWQSHTHTRTRTIHTWRTLTYITSATAAYKHTHTHTQNTHLTYTDIHYLCYSQSHSTVANTIKP